MRRTSRPLLQRRLHGKWSAAGPCARQSADHVLPFPGPAVIDAESIDLPGADLAHEEQLTVAVVQEQTDEFTCASCFPFRHRSQHAHRKHGVGYRPDCAG